MDLNNDGIVYFLSNFLLLIRFYFHCLKKLILRWWMHFLLWTWSTTETTALKKKIILLEFKIIEQRCNDSLPIPNRQHQLQHQLSYLVLHLVHDGTVDDLHQILVHLNVGQRVDEQHLSVWYVSRWLEQFLVANASIDANIRYPHWSSTLNGKKSRVDIFIIAQFRFMLTSSNVSTQIALSQDFWTWAIALS